MATETRLAGATIAAKSTLASARVVARSFAEHHPGLPFYVLLADEVDGYFDPDREPFELLLLRDLDLPDARRFGFGLPQQPLSYAATPFLLARLLDLGYGRVLFVKQESLVLADLTEPVATLPPGGIALSPHLMAPLHGPDAEGRELNILLSGVFNIGFVGIAEGNTSRRFLAWWQDRVFRHCRHAVAEGMHYEQRWLDLAVAYFDAVHVVRDPGVNVAHWNLPDRRVTVADGLVYVDGHVCRLFRFSGYDVDRPDAVTRYSERLRVSDLGDAALVFQRYRDTLLAEGQRETATWPYAYARFDNGIEIPDIAREIYADLDDVSRFGNPFAADGEHSFFRWLTQPAGGAGSPNRLWTEIYERRPDVKTAFPDRRRAFRRWIERTGAAEYGVSEALR